MKYVRCSSLLTLVLSAVLVLPGCGGGGTSAPPEGAVESTAAPSVELGEPADSAAPETQSPDGGETPANNEGGN